MRSEESYTKSIDKVASIMLFQWVKEAGFWTSHNIFDLNYAQFYGDTVVGICAEFIHYHRIQINNSKLYARISHLDLLMISNQTNM